MKKIIYIALCSCLLSISHTLPAQTKVTFYTDMGNFVMDLYDTLQPITTDNFKTLVNNKFYDSLIIHRVVANFVIQAGDPWGPATGPGWSIQDEFDANTSNVQKAVAMANAGPNTGGSQFFINLVDNLSLNANYPVFGMVTSGFPVVQNIGAVAVDANSKPLTDIFIDSARITAFPTGMQTLDKSKPILWEVYPNPANESSILAVKSDRDETIQVTVSDLLGHVLVHQKQSLNAGTNHIALANLNLTQTLSGFYFLTVTCRESVQTKKLLFRTSH